MGKIREGDGSLRRAISRLKKPIPFFILLFLAIFLSLPLKSGAAIKGDATAAKKTFKHYCAVCHGVAGGGNGVNAGNLDPEPRDFTDKEYMSSRKDEDLFKVIEGGGRAGGKSVLMPRWGKTLDKQQISDLIAYVRLFSGTAPVNTEKKDAVKPGIEKVSAETNCGICHITEVKKRVVAPNLGHEGSKLNKEWVFSFLKNPSRVRPVGFIPLTKTMMPNFQFSDEEARAITEFLMTKKDAGVNRQDVARLAITDAEIEKGKKLFDKEYGCIACHKINDEEGGIVGPDLRIAAKRLRPEWVFNWIKNPQSIRPDSPMPNLGVPDDNIRSIIAYLLSLSGSKTLPVSEDGTDPKLIAKGEKLVRDKNCAFCHTIDSFNSKKSGSQKDLF